MQSSKVGIARGIMRCSWPQASGVGHAQRPELPNLSLTLDVLELQRVEPFPKRSKKCEALHLFIQISHLLLHQLERFHSWPKLGGTNLSLTLIGANILPV